jgi:hypothetical protein
MAFVYFRTARSVLIETLRSRRDRPAGGLTFAGQTAAEPRPKFPGGWVIQSRGDFPRGDFPRNNNEVDGKA